VVSLGYAADGKRIRKKASGQTRTEVKDKLKALHSELDAGVHADPRRRCRRRTTASPGPFVMQRAGIWSAGTSRRWPGRLTWDHIDLDARTISVWRSVRAHGDTKTNRSRRTLRIPQIAVEALQGQVWR